MQPESTVKPITFEEVSKALQTLWGHKPWFKMSAWHEENIDCLILLDKFLKQQYDKEQGATESKQQVVQTISTEAPSILSETSQTPGE